MNKPVVIGCIPLKALNLIGINASCDIEVLLGESNIEHMKVTHPLDYLKYEADIWEIVSCPDYIGLNPKDGSIECVKEYIVDGEYTKVAVRTSNNGKYFARSIYILNKQRVNSFISCGTLKKTNL